MSMKGFAGRDFLSTLDFSPEEIRELVELAFHLKRKRGADRQLVGKVLSMLFFNPSVRTRTSCESAMAQHGGHAIALNAGKDTWNFEAGEGVVMDGNTQEHVKELAPVLSAMSHAVGIRKSELITTGSAQAQPTGSYEELARDPFIHRFAEFSSAPVINLESNAFHPTQGLADTATLIEKLGEPRGEKYVLTWAYHPKSLPVATPHSQLLSAANLGMEVTVLRPPGYDLAPEVMKAARERAEALGGSVTETDDVDEALRGARAVCAKAWGGLRYYGRFEEEARDKQALKADWMVDEAKMSKTDDAIFLHCLPVRRNVVVADEVLDSNRSAVIAEAENRLWTLAAVLCAVTGST